MAFVRLHWFAELRAVLLETVMDFVPRFAPVLGKAPARAAAGSSQA
jgi:hypothetical protein